MAAAQQTASTITEIVIRGNKAVSEDAIRSRMRARVGQPYVQDILNQDKEAVFRMGYFKTVDVKAVPLEGSNYRVTVDLDEFAEVKEVRIIGNTVFTTEQLMKVVKIPVGQVFNLDNRAPTATEIQKMYQEKGYFALVEAIEPLEDSPQTVSISIRESKVASVLVTGNTRTKDRVIRRLVKTRPGDVYNEAKFIQELQRVLSTQWFEKVDYDRKTENGYDVDLSVAVKEGRTGQVVFGAAIDPRSSFAGQIGLVDSNFRGTGQTLGINFSQALTGGPSGDIRYMNPWMDSKDTSFDAKLYTTVQYMFGSTGFGGGSSSPVDEQVLQRRTGASLSMSRPVGDRRVFGAGFKFEGIATKEPGTTDPNKFIKQDGVQAVAALSYNVNNRDLDIDPSRGSYFSASLEPGWANITAIGGGLNDPSLLGSGTFVRSTLEYRTYHTDQPPRGREIDAARRVLAFRARAGMVTGKVPFFEQFFVGGADTVRGYSDDRFWGNKMVMTSLEYRHPIQKSFNAILFADAGSAWGGFGTITDFDQSSGFKLHYGYGVGLGFKTPFGPIRLDFAFNENGKSRTHFLLGVSF